MIEKIRELGPIASLAYHFTSTPREFAKLLGIPYPKKPSKDVAEEINDNIRIIHCDECKEVFFADMDSVKEMQARCDHRATVAHQECMLINGFINSCKCIFFCS